MKHFFAAVVIGAALFPALSPSLVVPQAQALSCIVDSFTVQNNIERSNIIFAGTVTAIAPIETRYGDEVMASNNAVSFVVAKSWKGTAGGTITLTAPRMTFNGAAPFVVGGSYLVYGTTEVGEEVSIVNGKRVDLPRAFVECSRTGPLAQASEDLAVLNGSPNGGGETAQPQPFSRNLWRGLTGAEVSRLQDFLEQRNYLMMPPGVAKGYFGSLTQRALMQYQLASGIQPAAGYFGPVTRAKVNAEIGSEQ